jgi:hypothetical protein
MARSTPLITEPTEIAARQRERRTVRAEAAAKATLNKYTDRHVDAL